MLYWMAQWLCCVDPLQVFSKWWASLLYCTEATFSANLYNLYPHSDQRITRGSFIAWQLSDTYGPVSHPVQPAPSATQMSLLVWDQDSCHCFVQHPCCALVPVGMLVFKWGVVRHIVGVLLSWSSRKWLHDQPIKTWSEVNGTVFHCYFKGTLSK